MLLVEDFETSKKPEDVGSGAIEPLFDHSIVYPNSNNLIEVVVEPPATEIVSCPLTHYFNALLSTSLLMCH
ncbi:hypothetical protein HBH61_221830 [Parastagonospora nodorum]|nr:hypothetical protein HBH61_221830 [Parastagonospora nodorum]KAH5442271.1 hypothetical protein HBI30_234730 [Parastagonospora nodorum]